MPNHAQEPRVNIWVKVLGVLVLIYICNYYYWYWGLVTVSAKDEPLGRVIRSIEWQGWVKIDTNVPLDTKVTLNVDRVPLAEAMEELAGKNRLDWNLAFFAGDSRAEVNSEISAFETGSATDDMKVYLYPTVLQLIGKAQISASDPRLQNWPGMKAIDASTVIDASAVPAENSATAPATNASPTVQTYLRAFAESANIWIMAPDAWTSGACAAPPPDSSISHAVQSLVGDAHGVVTQAIILRSGRGGPAGNPDGIYNDMLAMSDRLRNAINGLPPEERAAALGSLEAETQFYQGLQSAPEDQRRLLARKHIMETILYSDRLLRLSPEQRGQFYQRKVTARQAPKTP